MRRGIFEPLLVMVIAAVLLNFVWEMAQSVLFAPMGGWVQGTWRCFVASLADGVIVLIIFGIGWLWFQRADWAYTERMPVLPVVHVGLVPVLQIVIVPAMAFQVAVRVLKGTHGEIGTR